MRKNKSSITIILLLFAGVISFTIGAYIGKKRGIPFIGSRFEWSIGIYEGESPFKLIPSINKRNPVLTAKHVTDIKADFVADPFMIKEDNIWYMFFEVFNSLTQQGDIGLAISRDGLNWEYKYIILDEPFHLSYPYVFKHGKNYYMIPESINSYSLRIYKAVDFPKKWSFIGKLLDGMFEDPSIFRYENRWWIFAETNPNGNDTLCLYYADNLFGPWKEHPKNPIVKGNPNIARPGGRVVVLNNKVYRFAQDDYPTYGNAVRAFEITELTITNYKENELPNSPILKGSKAGWNALGMHHVDIHRINDNKWIACVDGLRKQIVLGLKY